VKTSLLTLFLTALGVWGQTPVSLPAFPAFPTNAVSITNRQQALQQALRRALDAKTNTPAPVVVGTTALPIVGTASSAPGTAVGNPPQPAATPGGAVSNAPTGTVTPAPAPAAPGPSAPLSAQTAPAAAVPAATSAPADETIPPGMIDFRQADLNQVLDIYSSLVNRTILRPATLPAPTIVLKTQTLLTKKEAIQALDAVLALNGITMVNIGDKFVKALPEAQSISAGARFDTNSASFLPELGQFVTHVVQLKYAKPTELMPILQPFVKIPNSILPIDSSMMLVLRDYSENVKRMLELVTQIDVAAPSEYVSEVIPIKYAKATEIANALNSLGSGGGSGTLGGGGTTGGGALGGTRGTRSGGMTGGMGGNRMGNTGVPGQMGMQGMNTPVGGAGMPTQAGGASSFSQRLQNIIQRASATGEIQVLGQTKILADERTNSLLIYAGKDDMKTIKDIVAKLDVVLAQVLIEAAVIEVDLTDSRTLGFSYLQHPQNSGQWTGVGAINNGTLFNSGTFGSGTNSAAPSGFSYLMSFGQDLDVAVAAAASDSKSRILQRPRIQTSHNEPANIFVGTTQPYPTSSYYGGGAYGGYSSIQQMQIGVTLQVTPLINPDGLVVMDISMQIDGLAGSVTIANVGDVPITSSKTASAKVSVRDHDTIILGGLIYSEKDKSASGIPYLMNVPLLGYLFRYSSAKNNRTELTVLIRPTVLPTPEIAALTATAEQNKLPATRRFIKDLRNDEVQQMKHEDKQDKQDK
jgi:general secretion pathway protein D